MDNKTPTHDELIWMNDDQLAVHWYMRTILRGWAMTIKRIQELPREAVAKLEEVNPDELLHDVVFPNTWVHPHLQLSSYFLREILWRYTYTIEQRRMLKTDEITQIVDILYDCNFLWIENYVRDVPSSADDDLIARSVSQIKVYDTAKIINNSVSVVRTKLEQYLQSQK